MQLDKLKILILLSEKNMTQSDLAELYGASRTRIGVILNCRTVRPLTAGKLAKALGVDVTEILAD